MIELRIVRYPFECLARTADKFYHKEPVKEQRTSRVGAKTG
jgi:hypothetical protein